MPKKSKTTSLRSWPADKVEKWPIEAIHPYPRNARLHSDEQIDLIAASIEKYGFTAPLLVDEEGVLIYGHGRHRAAQKLGLTDLPVCVAVGWSEEDKAAYRIADNQIALRSTWDMPLLQAELNDLSIVDYDMPLLGFTEQDLKGFDISLGASGQTDPEAIPPPPAQPISNTGDLWILGGHRLLCGDATSADDVQRLMKNERAALFATDPPYAVGYSGGAHPATKANRAKANRNKNWVNYAEAGLGVAEKDDEESAEKFYSAFIKVAVDVAIIPKAPWYCWHASKRQAMVERTWNAAGAFVHQQIIWVKSRAVITYAYYMWRHEPCLFGWIKGSKPKVHRGQGTTLNTIWEVPNSEVEAVVEHPTVKPTRLFTIPIQQHTSAGDICYEPFSGSGTQIIAAETTGRRCFALEISPVFVDVAVKRWENFTGLKATLESTGETFAETEAKRKEKGLPAKQGGPRVRVSTS